MLRYVAQADRGDCGSGDDCPNAPVTRGQMAVLLATALGLHWGSPFESE